MNWVKLEEELVRDEDLRQRVYICPAGYPTIGVGHQLLKSEMDMKFISIEEVGRLLASDIKDAVYDLDSIFGKNCLDRWTEARQHALLNMVFNMGQRRLRGFKKMVAAIKADDWEEAAVQAEDSLYFRKAGVRAVRVRDAIRKG